MLLFVIFLNISCAELKPPTPIDILKHPLGTDPLYRGMSKEEVVGLWGQPNEVNKVEQEKWSPTREEWVYYARYPKIPVDANYLSKDKHLYFEGNALVSWKEKDE